MTTRRLLMILAVGVVVEAGVFLLSHRDLIALRQPIAVASPGPADCSRTRGTLLRRRLTEKHLEQLAAVADRCGDLDAQITALKRLYAVRNRNDWYVLVRLGEVLREAQRYDEAEVVYSAVLNERRDIVMAGPERD